MVQLTFNRLCFVLAFVFFVIAALPTGIDAPLIAIGLALMALGHAL
jgi:hypothetical protein